MYSEVLGLEVGLKGLGIRGYCLEGYCETWNLAYWARPAFLNSSTIDELGSWCLKGWWSQVAIRHGEEVSMATLQAATLGQVVQKPINANPRLKVNRGFHLAH